MNIANTMKKSMALALAGLMAVSFSSCGKKEEGAYFQNVKPSEYVTLGEYKGLTVSSNTLDENWSSTVSSILNANATDEEVTERVSMPGDTVTYSATVVRTADGSAVDSMNATNATFTIGTTEETVTGLGDALTGIKTSETAFSAALTTADNYSETDTTLNNLPVTYTITVSKITEHIVPTELTDKMVSDYSTNNDGITYDTVAEYQTYVRENRIKSLAGEIVEKNCTVNEYPDAEMRQIYMDTLESLNATAEQMSSYGYTFETYVPAYFGVETLDEGLQQVKEQSISQTKSYLIYLAVFDAEKLDYTAHYDDYKDRDGYKDMDKSQVILYAKMATVGDFLLKNATEKPDDETDTTEQTADTAAVTAAATEEVTTAEGFDPDATVKAD